MLKAGLAFLFLSFGFVTSATTVNVVGYHPVYCPGEPTKAVRIANADLTDTGSEYLIEVHAQLLECMKDATDFSSYVPQTGEYAEVFQLSSTTQFRPQHLPLAAYAEGSDYTKITFAIPKAMAEANPTFRMDIYLYGGYRGAFQVLFENGQAKIH
jgi:hypothetical protein